VPRSTHGQQRVNVAGGADRHGWPARHTHYRRGRSPDGTVVALARLGVAESRRPGATLLSSHAGWHQSDGRPEARPARPRHVRLLPRLARSVGFGPVFDPPHTARSEQLSTTPASSQSGHDARANRVTRSGSDPTCRRSASRAAVASTSSQSRSPARTAASATGCRCEGQRQCR
jgi:hypothetical protein